MLFVNYIAPFRLERHVLDNDSLPTTKRDAPILGADIHRLTELRLAAVEDRVADDLDAGRQMQVAARKR
jgi:hypothetical protein